MIQHIVMLAIKRDIQPVVLQGLMAEFAALQTRVPGFVLFQHGPNLDLEAKSQGHSYGFICTFADKGSLQAYADHDDHKLLGARLAALCDGHGDGIWVADVEIS